MREPGHAVADHVPDQLPVLGRGRHDSPEDGACVMEYVSVLTGGKFTDHPRSTHPALAALARLVNDRIEDDAVRGELARLAPDLIDTASDDPRVVHLVISGCLRAAHRAGALRPSPTRRLARTRMRLERLSGDDRSARIRLRCWRWVNPTVATVGSAFGQVVEQLHDHAPPDRDARLRDLLRDVARDCRAIVEGCGMQAPTDRASARSV